MFNFALDAKDADIWTGTPCFVDSAWIVNPDGTRTPLAAQVVSAVEGDNYSYRALEWSYGASVPEDDDIDNVGSAIVLSGELTDLNLRAVYDNLFPSISAGDDVRFIFDLACTAGGTGFAFAVDTGEWPELDTPPLIDVRGLLIGRGGNGADVDGVGVDGGVALRLQNDIRLSNTGIIGGGGGGGAYDRESTGFDTFSCGGGGGAGFILSQGGQPSFNGNEITFGGSGGTKTSGGFGGFTPEAQGGTGGGLGQAGETTAESVLAGAAGAAIVTNGYTIDYVGAGAGDIRGAII
jgi:hypothetical protein